MAGPGEVRVRWCRPHGWPCRPGTCSCIRVRAPQMAGTGRATDGRRAGICPAAVAGKELEKPVILIGPDVGFSPCQQVFLAERGQPLAAHGSIQPRADRGWMKLALTELVGRFRTGSIRRGDSDPFAWARSGARRSPRGAVDPAEGDEGDRDPGRGLSRGFAGRARWRMPWLEIDARGNRSVDRGLSRHPPPRSPFSFFCIAGQTDPFGGPGR